MILVLVVIVGLVAMTLAGMGYIPLLVAVPLGLAAAAALGYMAAP